MGFNSYPVTYLCVKASAYPAFSITSLAAMSTDAAVFPDLRACRDCVCASMTMSQTANFSLMAGERQEREEGLGKKGGKKVRQISEE